MGQQGRSNDGVLAIYEQTHGEVSSCSAATPDSSADYLWEIDQVLECLVGADVRVAAKSFAPGRWDRSNRPPRLVPVREVFLPDDYWRDVRVPRAQFEFQFVVDARRDEVAGKSARNSR